MEDEISGEAQTVLQRCQLEPDNPNAICGSRLIDFQSLSNGVEATYLIVNLIGDNEGCLKITQRYEFAKEYDPTNEPSQACEPSATLPCAKFRPLVTYEFLARPSSNPNLGLNTVQRLYLVASADTGKVIGNYSLLSHDCDDLGCAILSAGTGVVPFGKKIATYGPLFASGYSQLQEGDATAIQAGKKGDVDNYHQTYRTHVMAPTPTFPKLSFCKIVTPGCPECVHIHWRWTSYVNSCGDQFGGGLPIIPQGSLQSVDVAVSLFHTGEDDPYNYHDLLNKEGLLGGDTVLWYSARSHAQKDTFFNHQASYSSSATHTKLVKR